jgi:hypothetical protein
VRNISLIGLKLIIFDIVVPHLPQITSVDGYDITIKLGAHGVSKIRMSKSIDQLKQEQRLSTLHFISVICTLASKNGVASEWLIRGPTPLITIYRSDEVSLACQ